MRGCGWVYGGYDDDCGGWCVVNVSVCGSGEGGRWWFGDECLFGKFKVGSWNWLFVVIECCVINCSFYFNVLYFFLFGCCLFFVGS